MEDTSERVIARAKLAQTILEESDRLPGFQGYPRSQEKWWLHPRHEREALACYLLLTCFDLLGQRGHTTFSNWLESKKEPHLSERERALEEVSLEHSPVEAAGILDKHYRQLYGVKNSFCRGVASLPLEAKARVLGSITVSRCPQRDLVAANVSLPSFPLEDGPSLERIKLEYLYERRNRFTHSLLQYHSASAPMVSALGDGTGSSWFAVISDSKLVYGGHYREKIDPPGLGPCVLSVKDWPFVLFEAIYAAVERPFDRTEVDLAFNVMVLSDGVTELFQNVKHSELPVLVKGVSKPKAD